MTEEEFKERLEGTTEIKYRGILDHVNPSSYLRLSSIPKSEARNPLVTFQYNLNAFCKHCADYKRYWEWVKNRNQKRYELNLGHQWDSKNTMHAIRIMGMGIELASGKGLILNRGKAGDREELLRIRRHELKYEEVKELMLKTEEEMKEAFEKSSLPDEPDQRKLEDILIQIREDVYEANN
jgi:hypothetical protein